VVKESAVLLYYVVHRAVARHVFGLSLICDGFKVHIYVYSVSVCLMLLTVLLVYLSWVLNVFVGVEVLCLAVGHYDHSWYEFL
jgi:hypothetical protein